MSSIAAKAQIKKAESFKTEAEAKLKARTWFQSSTEQKYEDAAELYSRCANAYKVGGLFVEAAEAYVLASDLHLDKLKQTSEASRAMVDAGACYKKASATTEAVDVYKKAITLLCDAGRLTNAAKLSKEIAEIFESEGQPVEAIECYEQAGELYSMEDSKSHASSCSAKVAELSSAALDPPDFLKAAGLYEELGKNCLDSALLKFNAKGYFLQCVLCHLANGDAIAAMQCQQRFQSMDYGYGDSREGKFCADLIECVEQFDADGFATVCFEYDRVSKLDAWKTSMLYKVKMTVMDTTGGGGGDEEDDDVDLT